MIKMTENERKKSYLLLILHLQLHIQQQQYLLCHVLLEPGKKIRDPDSKKNEPYMLNVNIYFHSSNDQIH